MDYRALIKDGKTQAGRRLVRHVICLNPSLYGELEEAQDELQTVRREEIVRTATTVAEDRRAGSLPTTPAPSPVEEVQARITEIESRIADASVVGVFKVLSPEAAAERLDRINKELEDNPTQSQAIGLRYGREEIELTFDHFEGPHQERLDLTKDDLTDILDSILSHGEIAALSNKVARAATEVHDAPKFVRSSLLTRNSDETSQQPVP